MKKIIVFALGIMMTVVLCACGGGGAGTAGSGSANPGRAAASDQNYGTDDLGLVFSATIEETVLADEQGIKITAQELTYTNGAAELALLLENNSGQAVTFMAGTLGYSVNSINGYMIPAGYVLEDVAAGMSAQATMQFPLEQLSMYGIVDIADISIGFQVDGENDTLLQTGSREIRTSIADSYDYSADTFANAMDNLIMSAVYGFTVNYKAEEPLFDDAGLKILNQYVVTNKDGEQSIFMEMINTSDQDLYASASDGAVNGITAASSVASDYIVAGKRNVMSISLENVISKEYLQLVGMNQYENFGCRFTARDQDLNALAEKDIRIAFAGDASPDSFGGEPLYDASGFKLLKVGIVEDSFEYSEDLHVLVLAKNNTESAADVSDGLNDVYVNKMKVADITLGQTVRPGGWALIDTNLMSYDLEANGLTLDNITEVTMKLEFRDDSYNVLAEADITVTK